MFGRNRMVLCLVYKICYWHYMVRLKENHVKLNVGTR